MHTVEELLAIGENKSWETNPGWSESLEYRRSELKEEQDRAVELMVLSLVFTFLFLTIVVVSGNPFSLVFLGMTGGALVRGLRKFQKTSEQMSQLLRVGIDFEVSMFQKQKARYDPPPYTC